MATSEVGARTPVGSENDEDDAFIFVFDRRSGDLPEQKIKTGGLFSFLELKKRIQESLKIGDEEVFVITTTNRDLIEDDESWDKIDKGDTLYVLQDVDQELCAPAEERVSYLPHYDTIVKGGMYEYYASEGQNPLPYAFAELVDNALAATVDNENVRKIELRLYLDDRDPSKSCMVVFDNGTGMTPRDLNNWAVYRLSKFNRNTGAKNGEEEPEPAQAPRSLNSDISYFGVGGKQAIFFIGTATRVITKTKNSKDVHELAISKEDFERKEKNKEAIYSGKMRNRKAGDYSHLPDDDGIAQSLAAEELTMDSFTAVVITNINQSHVPYLKSKLTEWTTQLSHIYHYYLHGPGGHGGDTPDVHTPHTPFKNIDIEVKMYNRGQCSQTVTLRDIGDDTQSCCIRTAMSTFDFKATVEGTGVVEGIIRYHPFLYDRETYPSDAIDPRADKNKAETDDVADPDSGKTRRRRPIFECYWNGRLIPYTMIDDFEWCSLVKKAKFVPPECYSRISGVLWTNDKFQVSTNKLTFIDLELKLKDKNTVFSRMVSGQGSRATERRTAIDKEFTNWLRECHEQCDKQIEFRKFVKQVTRKDQPKNRQTPWAAFEEIEWDGQVFSTGDLVRIFRTNPITYGSIARFLLYGDHGGDVFGTGGDIEIVQEPQCLYDNVKTYPLAKLDRTASLAAIKRYMDEEKEKLPHELVVSWPDGNEVTDGQKRPAGLTIGDIKVEIANKRGEMISKLPGNAAQNKRLLVELKIIWHSPNGDEEMVSHISQHGKTWPYWFRKMENIRNLGAHSLHLHAVLGESGARTFADTELPHAVFNFTVTEAESDRFTIQPLEGPYRVAAPFTISLDFTDEFGNPSKPSKDLRPVLEASGVKLTYERTEVRSHHLHIKNITAVGNVGGSMGKNFNLLVKIANLNEPSQSAKLRLLPGPPFCLRVKPEQDIVIQNGQSHAFDVSVLDKAGNLTCQPRLTAVCTLSDIPDSQPSSLDLSSTGSGRLTTEPILIRRITVEQQVSAKIELSGHREVSPLTRTIFVSPSNKPTQMSLSYLDEQTGQRLHILPSTEIKGTAGEYIRGMEFTFKDEANRVTKCTDAIASKMKANWVPRLMKEPLYSGQLPEIKIPTSVAESKYCTVQLANGSGIECSFTVRGVPGDAAQLACKVAGSNRIILGGTLEAPVVWQVKDKFANDLKWLPSNALDDVEINSEGLDVEKLDISVVNGAFVLKNVCYTDGVLGHKDLGLRYGQLSEISRLLMVAGRPTKLVIVDWDVFQPVTVINEERWGKPLVVQLCDDSGNPTTEPDVCITLAKDSDLKLIPEPKAKKVNDKGQVDFGLLEVSGPIGLHEIQPVAKVGLDTIPGPKIKVSIQPDVDRPVNVQVEYNKNQITVVGGNLPTYTVRMIAEDGSVLKTAQATNLTMKLWKADQYFTKPPENCVRYSSDMREDGEEDGTFKFSGRKVPEVAGSHCIIFDYTDERRTVLSNQIPLVAMAGPPVKLIPVQHPGTPTVSNTGKIANRVIFKVLKLELRDRFDNIAGQSVNGSLAIEMVKTGVETPFFTGHVHRLETPFTKGWAQMSNCTIDEGSPGKDGQQYTIQMYVISNNVPKNHTIPPYEMTFLFYNDARKQSAMAELTKERDTLMINMKVYEQLFTTTEQLVDELQVLVREAEHEERRLSLELKRQGLPESQLNALNKVEKLMDARGREKIELMTSNRRKCSLVPAPSEAQVLGKVCHLAQVEEGDVCRVLSWHMSADMDCTVTHTLRKAKEIYQQSNGKQQVLPLESIYKRTLPDWKKPLPHVKFRPNWNPPGNPVYARDLLRFNNEPESCKLVFGMLLGDTIILDDLDRANNYRAEIVKHTHCPTILTRSGDRIRSNGKFGGLMNKAPPIERLKGAIFNEPLPTTYGHLCSQLELLQRYHAAMQKRYTALQDLDEQKKALKNKEMNDKKKEFQHAQMQLKKLNETLGIGEKRKNSKHDPMVEHEEMEAEDPAPSTSAPPEDAPPPTKRARTSAQSALQPKSSPRARGRPRRKI